MGPSELDTPDTNGDQTRPAGSDTPHRAEHPQAGDGGQGQARRVPAETLTRDDYSDRLRENGPPVPADTGPADGPPAASHPTQAPDRDRRHPHDQAEPRDRESYIDDVRADTPSSQPAGQDAQWAPSAHGAGSGALEAAPAEPRSRDDYTDTIRTSHDSPVPPTTPPARDTGETTAAGEPGHEITAPDTTAADGQQQPAGHHDSGPAPAELDPEPSSGHGTDEQPGGQAAAGDGHSISHYHGEFKGQALDLYTDGTHWAPGDRADADNVTADKPDRSPGDTSDLPPPGEQLLTTESDKASRAERMRREGYRQADGVLNIASKWTEIGHDLLARQPPAGHAEVSTRPAMSTAPHEGLNPGDTASALLVFSALAAEAVGLGVKNWHERKGHPDGSKR